MINKIFPKEITNAYQGKAIAKWVFIAIVVMTIARSFAHIFLPDGGAQSIATIPLDDFTSSGATVIIACLLNGDYTTDVWLAIRDCALALSISDSTNVALYLA